MYIFRSLTLLLISTLVFACTTSEATAQDKDIPDAVYKNFKQKYPNATKLDWEIDRNDNFEAQFEVNGNKARADFSPDGTWIETEESLKWKDLPDAVQEAIKSEYDKDDIVELEHTMNAKKGEFYDVEIDEKGAKKFDVEYRADGSKL